MKIKINDVDLTLSTFRLVYEELPSAPHRDKSRKVLTNMNPKRIMEIVNKANRKDDKMLNDKNNQIIRHISLALLAIAAVNGIAGFLGGSLTAVFVASVLALALYAHVVEF